MRAVSIVELAVFHGVVVRSPFLVERNYAPIGCDACGIHPSSASEALSRRGLIDKDQFSPGELHPSCSGNMHVQQKMSIRPRSYRYHLWEATSTGLERPLMRLRQSLALKNVRPRDLYMR